MPPSQPTPLGLNPATFDIGNKLLAPTEYELTATVATGPDGTQALIATIRDQSTTMTCFLTAEQADTWIGVLTGKRDKMSTLTIARAMPPTTNGGHPR